MYLCKLVCKLVQTDHCINSKVTDLVHLLVEVPMYLKHWELPLAWTQRYCNYGSYSVPTAPSVIRYQYHINREPYYDLQLSGLRSCI